VSEFSLLASNSRVSIRRYLASIGASANPRLGIALANAAPSSLTSRTRPLRIVVRFVAFRCRRGNLDCDRTEAFHTGQEAGVSGRPDHGRVEISPSM
jgi:hypothetical protein